MAAPFSGAGHWMSDEAASTVRQNGGTHRHLNETDKGRR
jgi:hypothetical protein